MHLGFMTKFTSSVCSYTFHSIYFATVTPVIWELYSEEYWLVIVVTNDNHFGLVDISQQGLGRNTALGKKEEGLSTVNPTTTYTYFHSLRIAITQLFVIL